MPHLNECIFSVKLMVLNMSAKDQGNSERISQGEDFTLTNTHMCTLPTAAGEREESFMPHRDFGS